MAKKENSNAQVTKAIEIVELKTDRDQLLAQANALSGAITYISQKIAALEAPAEEPKVPIEGGGG